ncbi:MAG: hypothetical protein HQ507_03850 [Candidatus Marinimicrobia bacterium]|nr:hypothetical protein [Candidatus Neomarinimicrobiota bacterium]
MAIDSSAEYGKYIANNVGNCFGCHTARSLKTGEFYGQPFAGGTLFPADPMSHGYSFVAPNLAPHKTGGIIALWDESTFVNRFRAGRVRIGSPMPWGAFSRLDEVELKALYRYLQSIDPVPGKVEKTVYAPGESLPS